MRISEDAANLPVNKRLQIEKKHLLSHQSYNYECTQTDRHLSLFEKERSGYAGFSVGEIHAWHQQNIIVAFHFRTDCHCCKAIHQEIMV